jgi:beta-N-acetylhexosaminidase
MTGITELARGVIFAGIDRIVEVSSVPSFGGYVLFGRDDPSIDEVHQFTSALRARCAPDPPPVIAIDQEGGRVVRLRRDVEPMPSMMALGAAADLELAARAGEQVAFDLRRAGCTMDFAPVLDLALQARNTAIGTRSLGSDPERVGQLAAAFARGLKRGGIAPCYKHFPGHGDTSEDSHETVPVVEADLETLRRRDLAPFARVAAGAPAIMLAHVIVRALDENHVASASETIAGGVLRGLGFTGIAITDCLTMAGAGDSAQAAVSALQAGADAVIVSRPWEAAETAVDAVVRAVAEERLTLERLSAAYERIVRVRATASDALADGEFPPHPGVGREIARRAVTLVRGLAHADPLTCAVLSFEGTTADGVVPDDVRRPSLSAEAPALAHVALPIDPWPGSLDDAFALLARTGRRPIVLARRAHLYDRQAGAIASIVDRYPDALVVSALEPFDVPLFAQAQHVVACYGDDASAIGGLADVLFANVLPEGRLPVDLSR